MGNDCEVLQAAVGEVSRGHPAGLDYLILAAGILDAGHAPTAIATCACLQTQKAAHSAPLNIRPADAACLQWPSLWQAHHRGKQWQTCQHNVLIQGMQHKTPSGLARASYVMQFISEGNRGASPCRDADTLERVLRTNLISGFATIQAFYPLLKVRGQSR